jgi:helicase
MGTVEVDQKTADSVMNLVLDTIDKEKQALVFVNTKRSAEKSAEDIGKKTGLNSKELEELSEKIRTVLGTPTKQCERLAKAIKGGSAFHHAGLHAKQKELIEDNFKKGVIKIISCTPTLAMGVDMPAYRVLIRDVKRFGPRGMQNIPVLEYLQMAGRAGRPKFDNIGEAIIVANSSMNKEEVTEKYIYGEPEDIYSKLAVEPVLRTYVLSLIATRFVKTKNELLDFFSKTFWAYQFKDMEKLEIIIDKMLDLLDVWGFVVPSKKQDDFVNAADLVDDVRYRATFLGKRVAELYLDPLTAHELVLAINKSKEGQNVISYLHTICTTLEMRPLLNIGVKDYEAVEGKMVEWDELFIVNEPSAYDPEYDEFMKSVKTTMFLAEWMEEFEEQYLLETYNVRPGETRAKLQRAEWLLYSMTELANILSHNDLIKDINKLRFRLRYGVKEELLPLLKLKGVGRVRARKMFNAGIKDVGSIKKVEFTKLKEILGHKMAVNVKGQVGETVIDSTQSRELTSF